MTPNYGSPREARAVYEALDEISEDPDAEIGFQEGRGWRLVR